MTTPKPPTEQDLTDWAHPSKPSPRGVLLRRLALAVAEIRRLRALVAEWERGA